MSYEEKTPFAGTGTFSVTIPFPFSAISEIRVYMSGDIGTYEGTMAGLIEKGIASHVGGAVFQFIAGDGNTVQLVFGRKTELQSNLATLLRAIEDLRAEMNSTVRVPDILLNTLRSYPPEARAGKTLAFGYSGELVLGGGEGSVVDAQQAAEDSQSWAKKSKSSAISAGDEAQKAQEAANSAVEVLSRLNEASNSVQSKIAALVESLQSEMRALVNNALSDVTNQKNTAIAHFNQTIQATSSQLAELYASWQAAINGAIQDLSEMHETGMGNLRDQEKFSLEAIAKELEYSLGVIREAIRTFKESQKSVSYFVDRAEKAAKAAGEACSLAVEAQAAAKDYATEAKDEADRAVEEAEKAAESAILASGHADASKEAANLAKTYADSINLDTGIKVLPLGTTTSQGAAAYGLVISPTEGVQLWGTHFLVGSLWDETALKMVVNNISLATLDQAYLSFDYANKVTFRSMPNDGNEGTYALECWEWTDDSHTTKAPTAGVKLLKPNQSTGFVEESVLNMSEMDSRYSTLNYLHQLVDEPIAQVESNTKRIDNLEGIVPYVQLGLGWFQPNDSAEADSTAGYLDDKRRILIGLDKTQAVSMVKHGSVGSDGKWHDNTGIYAGIYAKFYDHTNQCWKPAVPTAHATGKLYAENTLDRMGVMPWAGFREEVLTNTINGVSYEQHVIKIPKFYKAKFYNQTIRWQSAAASTGYVDVTGRLVIILPEIPARSFSIGYDADGAGTNVLTVSPEDFELCGSCYRPQHIRSDTGEMIPAGETDFFYVSKYHPTNKTVGGVALLVSEKTNSANPANTRGAFATRAKANNRGSGRYIAASLPMVCWQDLMDLYEVEFATSNSQSVNTGACLYSDSIGMAYRGAWTFNNAENLDDNVRLGLEDIPCSGFVDYYGKAKTETDRATDSSAAETVGNGKQYLSRFIWRGMVNDIFGTAFNFLGDIEVIQYASGEALPSDFPLWLLHKLTDAGYTFSTTDGVTTVTSAFVDVVCRRRKHIGHEKTSALTVSSAASRDAFWESYIQTGIYEVLPVALPSAAGYVSTRDAEGGMEFPSRKEKDFGIGSSVDHYWTAAHPVAAVLVGGFSNIYTSYCGLRAWSAGNGAGYAYWIYGSRLYFVPF